MRGRLLEILPRIFRNAALAWGERPLLDLEVVVWSAQNHHFSREESSFSSQEPSCMYYKRTDPRRALPPPESNRLAAAGGNAVRSRRDERHLLK